MVLRLVSVGLLLYVLDCAQGQEIVVDAPCGKLRGKERLHGDGKKTLNFLGIPYAEPPVGDLRFRNPVRKARWEGIRDAQTYAPSCSQDPSLWRSLVGDWVYENYVETLTYEEDCLYLNVFSTGRDEGEPLLPVLVWIHGGGFVTGTAAFRLYEGDWLAADGDVIVVSINFRLGLFGFLTTADDVVPGNAALRDQVTALQWIRENIASFGGDPDRVTIFGESTGAASVAMHVLSPVSSGLFRAAIGQSGSVFRLTVSRPEEVATSTDVLLDTFQCRREDVAASVECLRAVPSEALLAVPTRFRPVIDGDFLPDVPDTLWRSGRFNKVPYMLGSNANEASLFFSYDPDIYNNGLAAEDVDIHIFIAANSTAYPNQLPVFLAIEQEYVPTRPDPFQNLRGASSMYQDLFYEAPKALMLDNLHGYRCPTFEYHFTHRPGYYPSFVYDTGAFHVDEIAFVFGAVTSDGILAKNSTHEEKILSKCMMSTWLSFAESSTPTYQLRDGTVRPFPSYTTVDQAYLEFAQDMTSENEKRDLHARADEFWNYVLPEIGG